MNAPLVVTRDQVLCDELSRLAAAAGVTPQICRSPSEALAGWSTAPLVLVGEDVAPQLARLRPGRRDDAYLIAGESRGHDLFEVALAIGVESVLELHRCEAWLIEALTDCGDRAPSRGAVVGVVGGCGGAGATTFACALAQVGARSGSALLVDLDPLGPGLDRVFGVEARDGVRWDALAQTTGRLSARSLHDAVPARDGVGVLTWPPGSTDGVAPFAAREALSAGQRGHDLVVIDLPRLFDPVTTETIARCDQVVILTVPTVAAVAATARVAARLGNTTSLRLVVRGHGVAVGGIERATGLASAIAMAQQRGLAEAVDLGLGPVRSARGPLARAAAEVLAGMPVAAGAR